MPTTFSTTDFLNHIVVAIHDSWTPPYQSAYYAEPYSGAQPSGPSATPAGELLVAVNTLIVGFNAPSGGVSQLAAPAASNATATSTVGFVRIKNAQPLPTIDVSVGLAGSGAGCILSSLSTSIGNPITITNLDVKMPYDAGGTLKLNSAVVDQLVKMVTGSPAGTALQMGINGSIQVYSGAAPADANMAATGVLLATIPTGATTPWATTTVNGGACALATSISAAASTTGTAGYVRWTKGLYTIQGSVGTVGADFVLDSVSLVSGVSVTLTEATITLV